jgi:hypothetical protein
MLQEQLSPEEIKLRNQEDRYIQEGKKDYERESRTRAVADARKERAKKIGAENQVAQSARL